MLDETTQVLHSFGMELKVTSMEAMYVGMPPPREGAGLLGESARRSNFGASGRRHDAVGRSHCGRPHGTQACTSITKILEAFGILLVAKDPMADPLERAREESVPGGDTWSGDLEDDEVSDAHNSSVGVEGSEEDRRSGKAPRRRRLRRMATMAHQGCSGGDAFCEGDDAHGDVCQTTVSIGDVGYDTHGQRHSLTDDATCLADVDHSMMSWAGCAPVCSLRNAQRGTDRGARLQRSYC